jgi:NADH-quinone oxidoreductase subunit E
MTFRLSSEAEQEYEDIASRYPQRSGALLPLLHLVQGASGYLSEEALDFVATRLGLPPARVYGVATFYPAFRLHPPPRHLIRVCGTLSCRLMGAPRVAEYLREKLEDVVVEEVDCLSCCGMGPVMIVDGELHQNLTLERIDQIIERLKLSSEGDSRG